MSEVERVGVGLVWRVRSIEHLRSDRKDSLHVSPYGCAGGGWRTALQRQICICDRVGEENVPLSMARYMRGSFVPVAKLNVCRKQNNFITYRILRSRVLVI